MKLKTLFVVAGCLVLLAAFWIYPNGVDLTDAAAQQPIAASQTAAPSGSEQQPIVLAQAEPAGDRLLASSTFELGTHFQRLSPTQPTSSGPDQIEVAEFFMYSCIHCYNFEPFVEQWNETKPDYVNFLRVPTVWNSAVRLHAQAFYAAEALGKVEETHTSFFREFHVNGNYLDSQAALVDFYEGLGVDADAFTDAFNSFAVHAKLQRADELTRRYRISSTPSIVVNGKYLTNASMAGGYPQLLELINELAASERGRN